MILAYATICYQVWDIPEGITSFGCDSDMSFLKQNDNKTHPELLESKHNK